MGECECADEATEKPNSPGPVLDHETIVWVIFDPDNFQDGEIVGGISTKRLKKADFSVIRAEHTPLETAQVAVIDQRTGKDGGPSFVGVVTARCDEIRNVMRAPDDKRMFCVVDDPIVEDDFLGHALIRFSDATKPEGYWAKKANNAAAAVGNLLQLFSKTGAPLALEQCLASGKSECVGNA